MWVRYQDIIDRAGPPDWWAPRGVPRYGAFDPRAIDIYAEQVALYEIACQGCGYRFKATSTWSSSTAQIARMWRLGTIADNSIRAALEQGRGLDYGDPPNVGCCDVGPTMTACFVRLLEYHEVAPVHFVRVAEIEALPQPDETQ